MRIWKPLFALLLGATISLVVAGCGTIPQALSNLQLTVTTQRGAPISAIPESKVTATTEPAPTASTIQIGTSTLEPLRQLETTPSPEPALEEVSSLVNAQAATVQVIVQGSQFLEEFFFSGSGVIYDPSGLILTNNHLVEGAAIVQIKLENEEHPIAARVLGKSPCDDLAVVQISRSDLPFASLGGEADVRVGDDVFAIGFPLGEPHQATTKGVVSKTNLKVAAPFADYLDALQTDAAINPGNSGGPLVTPQGVVVGLNSASINSAQGTNFAISMKYAKPIISRLAAGENLNWVGVNAAPLPAEFAESYGIALEPGLFVYAVDSGSPADQMGLQEGDFITSIEGISVGVDGTLGSYCDLLRSHDNDDVLDVAILRNGTTYIGQFNGRPLEQQ